MLYYIWTIYWITNCLRIVLRFSRLWYFPQITKISPMVTFYRYDIVRTADVTSLQRMPTPPWHLILPLFLKGPCSLCSWFVIFLWNFDFEHCSLSPHFIYVCILLMRLKKDNFGHKLFIVKQSKYHWFNFEEFLCLYIELFALCLKENKVYGTLVDFKFKKWKLKYFHSFKIFKSFNIWTRICFDFFLNGKNYKNPIGFWTDDIQIGI